MKNPDEAKRWLEESIEELKTAHWDLEGKQYNAVCFWCQQAAEKALKSYLYYVGERVIWEHSVGELAKKCANYDKNFTKLIEKGIILDKYYIPTRYPNGLPYPLVPTKSFTEDESAEALSLAEEIINLVKSKVTGK